VQMLEQLMDDADRDVRDWAIFGIGVRAMPIQVNFAIRSSGILTIHSLMLGSKLLQPLPSEMMLA